MELDAIDEAALVANGQVVATVKRHDPAVDVLFALAI
jgi:hypothetical protein